MPYATLTRKTCRRSMADINGTTTWILETYNPNSGETTEASDPCWTDKSLLVVLSDVEKSAGYRLVGQDDSTTFILHKP